MRRLRLFLSIFKKLNARHCRKQLLRLAN